MTAEKLEVWDRVRVINDCEDGGDDWAIDMEGTLKEIDPDGGCEVRLDGYGSDTFSFFEYQLEKTGEHIMKAFI